MGKHERYDDAGTAGTEAGEVTVEGPDGVAVSLTPEPAAETGGRPIDAAAEAAGQRMPKKPNK